MYLKDVLQIILVVFMVGTLGAVVIGIIIIADNGSEDSTGKISKKLTYLHSNVYYLRIKEKGRGRALKRAWGNSTSEVMIYMDVDLSTNLDALIPLIDGIIIENFDICVGTRLSKNQK